MYIKSGLSVGELASKVEDHEGTYRDWYLDELVAEVFRGYMIPEDYDVLKSVDEQRARKEKELWKLIRTSSFIHPLTFWFDVVEKHWRGVMSGSNDPRSLYQIPDIGGESFRRDIVERQSGRSTAEMLDTILRVGRLDVDTITVVAYPTTLATHHVIPQLEEIIGLLGGRRLDSLEFRANSVECLRRHTGGDITYLDEMQGEYGAFYHLDHTAKEQFSTYTRSGASLFCP